jgi:hypothetical protein
MSTDATAQEIYDTIRGVVEDNYVVYTKSADQAKELLDLLNGNQKHSKEYYDYDRNRPVVKTCDKDSTSEECKKSWNNFWQDPNYDDRGLMPNLQYTDEEINAMCDAVTSAKMGKVNKWIIPVEEDGDDCVITFPDDLLEAANLKEGDQVQWIAQGNGSYLMKKVTKND